MRSDHAVELANESGYLQGGTGPGRWVHHGLEAERGRSVVVVHLYRNHA